MGNGKLHKPISGVLIKKKHILNELNIDLLKPISDKFFNVHTKHLAPFAYEHTKLHTHLLLTQIAAYGVCAKHSATANCMAHYFQLDTFRIKKALFVSATRKSITLYARSNSIVSMFTSITSKANKRESEKAPQTERDGKRFEL